MASSALLEHHVLFCVIAVFFLAFFLYDVSSFFIYLFIERGEGIRIYCLNTKYLRIFFFTLIKKISSTPSRNLKQTINHTSMHTDTHTYIIACIYTYVITHIYMYVNTHVPTYIYIYICIYIHTYMWTLKHP